VGSAIGWVFVMFDYRHRRFDPLGWTAIHVSASRGSSVNWAWIAGALVLVLLAALAFGAGRGANRALSNDTLPTATRLAPPAP